MADDISISFSADISELQQGLQEAKDAVSETTNAMREGAAQIQNSFASLSQAYAASVAQRAAASRGADDDELASARIKDRAEFDIAMNGLKLQSQIIREKAQMSQLSGEEARAALLASEAQREAVEQQHLTFLRNSYEEGSVAYENAQRKLDELASQGALRRQQIEHTYNMQVYNDYKRSFEQIGSSVSSSIMQMIEGHATLAQAARNVTLSIIQSFIQARIRMVADWAAGIATKTTLTQAGEVAETSATTAGVAARTSAEASGALASVATKAAALIKSITSSAAETFAGIFGFLSPLMGPAAAGPAAAGQASVAAVASGVSFDIGAWQLPADMLATVHKGEMIVPAAHTPWVQDLLANGGAGGPGGVTVNHATHFNISAADSMDVKRWFQNNGKTILRTINEAVRNGAHLGLSKLNSPV